MDVRLPNEEGSYASYMPADVVRATFGILTAYELAQALEVTTETLGTWRNKGQGPKHVKLGKQVFYRLVDVEDWIYEQAGDDDIGGLLAALEEGACEEPVEEPVSVKDPEETKDGW